MQLVHVAMGSKLNWKHAECEQAFTKLLHNQLGEHTVFSPKLSLQQVQIVRCAVHLMCRFCCTSVQNPFAQLFFFPSKFVLGYVITMPEGLLDNNNNTHTQIVSIVCTQSINVCVYVCVLCVCVCCVCMCACVCVVCACVCVCC